jgi:hypothetical protein
MTRAQEKSFNGKVRNYRISGIISSNPNLVEDDLFYSDIQSDPRRIHLEIFPISTFSPKSQVSTQHGTEKQRRYPTTRMPPRAWENFAGPTSFPVL